MPSEAELSIAAARKAMGLGWRRFLEAEMLEPSREDRQWAEYIVAEFDALVRQPSAEGAGEHRRSRPLDADPPSVAPDAATSRVPLPQTVDNPDAWIDPGSAREREEEDDAAV